MPGSGFRSVFIEDQTGNRLPYSKGLLAASLMMSGLADVEAYTVAEAIDDELARGSRDHLNVDELVLLVAAELAARIGSEAATRYEAWVRARRSARPVILLLGGATAVGKSTIASGVGARLGITRIIATDVVREVMRSAFPESVVPELHRSSFEAARFVRAPLPEDHDPLIVGFRQQAEIVGIGVRRLVERAITEGSGLIVEGVHLVPQLFQDDLPQWRREAVVCRAVLTISESEEHRAHFHAREERSPARYTQRYLDHFDEIRRLQRYISKMAVGADVPLVPVSTLDESVTQVLDLVVEAVTADSKEQEQEAASG